MARKILVVEDDRNISDLIRMYLEKEGFEVQTVFDGGSAVETFRSWEPDMVLLDTHYYGGVKKYQWVTLPLALHGVIAKKDGTVIPVNIGEKPEDPVFGVSDLLIHLAADQMEKYIVGEQP